MSVGFSATGLKTIALLDWLKKHQKQKKTKLSVEFKMILISKVDLPKLNKNSDHIFWICEID